MNKKLTIISFAAIFLLAGVGTFLFAQGGVGIAEKTFTMHKDITVEGRHILPDSTSAKTSGGENRREAALVEKGRNFNDSSYPVNIELSKSDMAEIKVIKRGNSATELMHEKQPTDSRKVYVLTDAQGYSQDAVECVPPVTIPSEIKSPGTEQPRLADEDISLPQLSLCDVDFEVDVDIGGKEDIALPQLPDVN